jgi:hypothetical protein
LQQQNNATVTEFVETLPTIASLKSRSREGEGGELRSREVDGGGGLRFRE